MASILKLTLLLFLAYEANSEDLCLGGLHHKAERLYIGNFYLGDSTILFRNVKEIYVEVADWGVITGVKVTDNREDKWGQVAITAGGVNQRFIEVWMKRPSFSRRLNFTVEVFGLKPPGSEILVMDESVWMDAWQRRDILLMMSMARHFMNCRQWPETCAPPDKPPEEPGLALMIAYQNNPKRHECPNFSCY